jgi:hypothetical protein
MALNLNPIIPSELPLIRQVEHHCSAAFRESLARNNGPEVIYRLNRSQCIEQEGIPLLIELLNGYFLEGK